MASVIFPEIALNDILNINGNVEERDFWFLITELEYKDEVKNEKQKMKAKVNCNVMGKYIFKYTYRQF